VILDARFMNYTYWYGVQPDVATFTRVCSYDHGGLGWSDAAPGPRTSAQLMTELHTFLHHAGVGPPYVLVADSQSQFDARVYHQRYPAELAGVVLTDGVPDDFSDKMDALKLKAFDALMAASDRFSRMETLLGPFGIPRLLGWCRPDVELPGLLPPIKPRTPLPSTIGAADEAMNCRAGHARGRDLEGGAFEESLREARAAGTFGHIPLVVVSRDPAIAVDPDWGADLSAAYAALECDAAGSVAAVVRQPAADRDPEQSSHPTRPARRCRWGNSHRSWERPPICAVMSPRQYRRKRIVSRPETGSPEHGAVEKA